MRRLFRSCGAAVSCPRGTRFPQAVSSRHLSVTLVALTAFRDNNNIVGNKKRLQQRRSAADAFLAGLRARPSTPAIPVETTEKEERRGTRVVKVVSVEELLEDESEITTSADPTAPPTATTTVDKVNHGHEAAERASGHDVDEGASLAPESIERETAFYGVASESVTRAGADGETILTDSTAAIEDGDADLSGGDTAEALDDTIAEDGTLDDLGKQDEEEDDEDGDLFVALQDRASSSSATAAAVAGGGGSSNEGVESEGRAMPGAHLGDFEGSAASEALTEALETMALLEEEEEAAAAAANTTATSSASLGGKAASAVAPGGGTTLAEMRFFDASEADLSAAKGSMEARVTAATNSSSGGTKTGFDADKTVVSAEMESMGEELKSPAR